MKGRFEKRASKAGAGNIKCGNVEVANLGRVFSRGIGQKEAYNKVEDGLTVDQIKKSLYNDGAVVYNALDEINEMLEVNKNLSFNELRELFDILDSKEKLVARFEAYEEYIRKNITEIRSEKDIKRLKRLFKLG